MRSPNTEQKKAIEQLGGGLLTAGAGSGKTFVIIRHLVYFIEQEIIKLKQRPYTDLNAEIRDILSSVVLMTFTKKAAGEMRSRLIEYLEYMIEKERIFRVVKDEIYSLYIGTIHGFCYRLLRQGLFAGVDPDLKIVNSEVINYRIKRIIRDWGNLYGDDLPDVLRDIFYSNISDVEQAFAEIFKDAELRLLWKENLKTPAENFTKNFWSEFFKIVDFNPFEVKIDLSPYTKENSKTWYKAIEYLKSFSGGNFSETYLFLNNFFKEFKRIIAPKKIEDDQLILTIKNISKLRKEFNSIAFHLEKFMEHGETLELYQEFYLRLFNYVDHKLLQFNTVSFSDLEYFTLQGLREEEGNPELKKLYSYFIVDEFQDTSETQFEILTRLAKDDLSNVFCVGDRQQAIYRFRGGEISVFNKFAQLTPKNFSLANNYRSSKEIVEHNNHFFTNLFEVGGGFEGRDPHQIEPLIQVAANESDHGHVKILEHQSESDFLSATELNKIEASIIASEIEENRDHSHCILYSKLRPSGFLINELMKKNIGFTAQVKIPSLENPILALFFILIKSCFEKESNTETSAWIFSHILKRLGLKSSKDFQEVFKQFEKDCTYFNPVIGFQKFLYYQSLSIADEANDMAVIERICQTTSDLEEILLLLEALDNSYSYFFNYGENSERVQMMSVHSSKGLEFDHVYLGGISTNGKSPSSGKLLGNVIGSFQWKEDFRSAKRVKSPMMILEEKSDALKNFSEQKRLFYVGCTRAKHGLNLIRIKNFEGTLQSSGKNSWVKGLDFSKGEVSTPIIPLSENSSAKVNTPLFHQNNLGYVHLGDRKSKILISTELSVTNYADLAICPRLFYLRQICGLGDEASNYLHQSIEELPEVRKRKVPAADGEVGVSDVKRGELIHFRLEKYLLGEDFSKDLNSKDMQAYLYGVGLVDQIDRSKFELLSERELKFELSGQTLNARPDLICLGDDFCEIWDFKTGVTNSVQLEKYKLQLYLYSYGVFQLFPEIQKMRLKIVSLDEAKVIDLDVDLEMIKEKIQHFHLKMDNPDEINQKYCPRCPMKTYCWLDSRHSLLI